MEGGVSLWFRREERKGGDKGGQELVNPSVCAFLGAVID